MKRFARLFLALDLLVITASLARSEVSHASAPAKYVVAEGDTLELIALRLYGNKSRWKILARWNRLKNPSRLYVGKTLRVKYPPTLSNKEGEERVIAHWRAKLGVNEYEPPAMDDLKKQVAHINRTAFEEAKTQAKKAEPTWESQLAEPQEAEQLFNRGQTLFNQNQFEKALPDFTKSRQSNERFLPGWLFEIRTLQALHREEEAKTVARALIKSRPSLKGLPGIKNLLASDTATP